VKVTRKGLAWAVAAGVACSALGYGTALAAPPPAHQAHPRQAHPDRRTMLPQPQIQLGAGVDLYTYRGQNFAKSAATEVAYLQALHANAVMVSFPFYISGPKSSKVFAKISTPTPADLAVFARAAKSAGLYFSLRPLMDQTSIGKSRAGWKPVNAKAWFASYQKFLLPYAAMAQQVGIPEFYVGAEFSEFGDVSYWNGLDQALRKVYKGTLAYANNGGGVHAGLGGAGVRISEDAYPDMDVPNNATVSRLTGAWEAFDKRQPSHTVLSEVGIAGVPGAFRKPWEHEWPKPKIDPTVQTRWFTSSCQAVAADHMGGIYFWAIGFGKDELSTGLSAKNQAAWEVGPGEQAVSACFRQLGAIRGLFEGHHR
jgi:hypothetical protein